MRRVYFACLLGADQLVTVPVLPRLVADVVVQAVDSLVQLQLHAVLRECQVLCAPHPDFEDDCRFDEIAIPQATDDLVSISRPVNQNRRGRRVVMAPAR